MISKNLKIKNKYDKRLSVILNLPKENIKDYIIFNHCFTCSKDYKIYNNISKVLASNGYATIRFDMMGLGNSEGDFKDSSFSTNIEDLISVYEFVKKNYKAPKFLIGHSLGGLISIKSSEKLEGIKGIAAIGTPFNLDGLKNIFSKYYDELSKNGKAKIDIAGREFTIGIKFLEDIKNEDIESTIKNFNKPIAIFHSNIDKVVDYKYGIKLFNAINSDKNFITLSGVNHLVSKKDDAYYIGHILNEWFDNIK
ncbi:alpha/beta hydrolase family protein [Senegalia sp. (in: firmicutes)]|uniref:alpha/beta hydrolase family protein n=1 Tax=Senegalia sp. (in: firmicutes) TaxID=1924098 RepID=UPI003F998519